jgi:hypothetical protein
MMTSEEKMLQEDTPDEEGARVEAVLPQADAVTDEDEALSLLAQEQNANNERCAAGCGGSAPSTYLTPEEVRAMDRRQVRDHYALIIESMKHWQ